MPHQITLISLPVELLERIAYWIQPMIQDATDGACPSLKNFARACKTTAEASAPHIFSTFWLDNYRFAKAATLLENSSQKVAKYVKNVHLIGDCGSHVRNIARIAKALRCSAATGTVTMLQEFDILYLNQILKNTPDMTRLMEALLRFEVKSLKIDHPPVYWHNFNKALVTSLEIRDAEKLDLLEFTHLKNLKLWYPIDEKPLPTSLQSLEIILHRRTYSLHSTLSNLKMLQVTLQRHFTKPVEAMVVDELVSKTPNIDTFKLSTLMYINQFGPSLDSLDGLQHVSSLHFPQIQDDVEYPNVIKKLHKLTFTIATSDGRLNHLKQVLELLPPQAKVHLKCLAINSTIMSTRLNVTDHIQSLDYGTPMGSKLLDLVDIFELCLTDQPISHPDAYDILKDAYNRFSKASIFLLQSLHASWDTGDSAFSQLIQQRLPDAIYSNGQLYRQAMLENVGQDSSPLYPRKTFLATRRELEHLFQS